MIESNNKMGNRENPKKPTYDELAKEVVALRTENARLSSNMKGRISASISGQSRSKDTALKVFFRNNLNFAEVFNQSVFKDSPINPDRLIELDSDESSVI